MEYVGVNKVKEEIKVGDLVRHNNGELRLIIIKGGELMAIGLDGHVYNGRVDNDSLVHTYTLVAKNKDLILSVRER